MVFNKDFAKKPKPDTGRVGMVMWTMLIVTLLGLAASLVKHEREAGKLLPVAVYALGKCQWVIMVDRTETNCDFIKGKVEGKDYRRQEGDTKEHRKETEQELRKLKAH